MAAVRAMSTLPAAAAALLLVLASRPAMAVDTDSTGENAAFERRLQAPRKGPGLKGAIFLALDFGYSTTTAFSPTLQQPEEGSVYQAGPALAVELRGGWWVLQGYAPYEFKVGFVQSRTLPGLYDLRTSSGQGDARVSLSVIPIGSRGWTQIQLDVTGIAPLGQSTYAPDYPGYLAIGNGFWCIPVSAGFQTTLNRAPREPIRVQVFANATLVPRLARAFGPNPALGAAAVRYKPETTTMASAGVGVRWDAGLTVALVLESIRPGSLGPGWVAPPTLTSIGLEMRGGRPRRELDLFAGQESSDDGSGSRWVTRVSTPLGIRLFGLGS